ncbi:MAG: hypothetical protein QOI63_932 [Thermoplasmata archaeon]|jgi:signal transduction histidine kinase|nr:hypothetical protein [Thermoplasmata archaeon]
MPTRATLENSPFAQRLRDTLAAGDDDVLLVGQVRLDREREAATELLRQRERQQAALARFAREALALPEPRALLDAAVREVRQATGADCVELLEVAPEGRHVTLRAGLGWDAGLVGHAISGVGPGTMAETVLASGRLVYARPDPQMMAHAPLLASHGCASGMSVAVPGRQRPFGILGAHWRTAHAIAPDAVDFLDALAHTLASALERRAAEAELEKARQSLEELVAERTRQLALSNRELEAFSYSVSHDLREPLRAIHGFSTLLAKRVAEVPGALDLLDRVRWSAARLGRLIDDLLDLSRVQRAELVRAPLDLAPLAELVLADLARTDPERAVAWHVQPGLACEGDELLLRTLLQNLLRNAWKFTQATPQARIEVTREGGHASPVFCVRDNGAGFDMAYAAKLFRPFERLHTAQEFEGTGIGLATVQRIVERHGGHAWAEGRPGHGAAFYFTLAPEPEPTQF